MALVKVKQGVLEGVVCDATEGTYVAFKGVPYAKPPIGKLRFKAPEPPEAWEGIRVASRHGPVCPQYNERLDVIETGSEDCLYLNVYTKTITPKQPLPVMVWIHGGAFYTGSGNSDFYGPEFIMAHDVILVTFNYRLEVLGFLCLDTEDVPGNAGLKDQVAALRWVKDNIASFGGDPNNITIFGCSAGSASVSHHLLSPMSQGLYAKAICQSGVCLNEWGYMLYGTQRAFQLGKLLGKDTENPNELLEFLTSVPTSQLVNVKLPLPNAMPLDLVDTIAFGPVIEKSELNVQKFITQTPLELIKNKSLPDIPLMLGYTSGEGIEIARNIATALPLFMMKGGVLPRELKLKLSPPDLDEADKKVREHYFMGKEMNIEALQEFSNLETDRLFVYNIQRLARYHNIMNAKPVYVYKFTVETERNFTKKQYKMENLKGVCHADDLPYLFNITNLEVPLTDVSRSIIKRVVQLWTNFASTGNPTPSSNTDTWKPFTETERNIFIIGENVKCVQNEDAVNMKLWEDIYGEKALN